VYDHYYVCIQLQLANTTSKQYISSYIKNFPVVVSFYYKKKRVTVVVIPRYIALPLSIIVARPATDEVVVVVVVVVVVDVPSEARSEVVVVNVAIADAVAPGTVVPSAPVMV